MGYVFAKHRKTAVTVYRIIYVAFVFIGAVAEINTVWLLADCFNALMALPNLAALFVLSPVVIVTTKAYFEKRAASAKDAEQKEAGTENE